MSRGLVIALIVVLIGALLLCTLVAVAGFALFRTEARDDGAVPMATTPETVNIASPEPTSTPRPAESQSGKPTPAPTATEEPVPTLAPQAGSGEGSARTLEGAPIDFRSLYQQVQPGVVAINVYVQQSGQMGTGAGSGFIIDEDGLIVTNEHVIADAFRVEVVFFDGTTAEAEVLGSDPDSDLAVIQVQELPGNVSVLPLGDSDTVEPGQPVVAIGNPFGLQNTITSGIISAVGRMIPARIGAFSIPQAIQTDAAINPGNSGGPLINMEGVVIGVNAQIVSGGSTAANAGVGFAIPVNIVRRVVPYLSEGKTYPWPWIGISGTDVNLMLAEADDLTTQHGAYVVEVNVGGPADRAGMRGSTGTRNVSGIPVPVGGDVIVAVDGDPINDFADLLSTVAFGRPGDEITVTVLRDGEELDLSVTLEQRPAH
ncbi:MAG: S1C family serine protease [Anaerolineae bacterium]|jgi:2-alkenal reductase